MTEPLDPQLYVRAPIITVSTGVTLCRALHEACPSVAPAHVKKAALRLKDAADKAEADLAARNRKLGELTEEDTRALDNEADRAWGGLRTRLLGMAMLDTAKYPRAKRAAELEAAVFPEGASFIKAEYSAQSTTMSSRLKQIDEDGLAADIDDIAGVEFLQAIRDVQPRYEAMVRDRLRRDEAMGQNLAGTVRSLQAAIVNYATKMLATIEPDDAATMEEARLSLLPIANFREASARGAVKGGEDGQGKPG